MTKHHTFIFNPNFVYVSTNYMLLKEKAIEQTMNIIVSKLSKK